MSSFFKEDEQDSERSEAIGGGGLSPSRAAIGASREGECVSHSKAGGGLYFVLAGWYLKQHKPPPPPAVSGLRKARPPFRGAVNLNSNDTAQTLEAGGYVPLTGGRGRACLAWRG